MQIIAFIFLFTLLVLLCSGRAIAGEQNRWPTQEWQTSSPEQETFDGSLLAVLDTKFREGEYGYIDNMLMIKNGKIVFDKT